MSFDELIDELQEERKSRYISCETIAKKVERSTKTINRIFNHSTGFAKVDLLEKIANTLGYELYLVPITRTRRMG